MSGAEVLASSAHIDDCKLCDSSRVAAEGIERLLPTWRPSAHRIIWFARWLFGKSEIPKYLAGSCSNRELMAEGIQVKRIWLATM